MKDSFNINRVVLFGTYVFFGKGGGGGGVANINNTTVSAASYWSER